MPPPISRNGPVHPVTLPPVGAGQPQASPLPRTGPVRARDTFEDRELTAMKRQAERTYASLIAKGARIEVTRSPGNNNKPVVTVVPPALANNTDPSRRYDVQVHYHGMHGTVVKPNPSSRLKEQIEKSFDRNPPTVYVLPETDNVPMQGSTGPLWASSVRDTGVTATDAVKGITGTRGQLTVSAHSLGRDALHAAIQRGGLKADRVDVQDGYSANRPDQIRALSTWMRAHPNVAVRISTGMMTKAAIRNVAPIPDAAFWKSFAGNHWGAEGQPWP